MESQCYLLNASECSLTLDRQGFLSDNLYISSYVGCCRAVWCRSSMLLHAREEHVVHQTIWDFPQLPAQT